mgnify:CR=1 FL=1
MVYKNLYIIGNGFDIHHGIKCGFGDFKEWLKKNDIVFLKNLTQVYENAWENNWWKDFENNLAQLNISYYTYVIGNLCDPEYLNVGSLEEKTEYAYHKVKEEFSVINNSLRADFQKWLDEAYRMCNKEKKLQLLGENSIFLSFNYTKTLEDIYGIDSRQICHIHGVIDKKDSMIVGHGLGFTELNDIHERQKPRVLGDVRNPRFNLLSKLQLAVPRHIELATQKSKESILSLRKDVEGCIEKNNRFFEDILDVQRIFVYGFSFSPIDTPYLEKIIRRTSPETHWIISWFSYEDKRRIMDFVTKYNIQNITIIKGVKYLDIKI